MCLEDHIRNIYHEHNYQYMHTPIQRVIGLSCYGFNNFLNSQGNFFFISRGNHEQPSMFFTTEAAALKTMGVSSDAS